MVIPFQELLQILEKVDYRDLNINFAILFNPEYASEIPHEFYVYRKI